MKIVVLSKTNLMSIRFRFAINPLKYVRQERYTVFVIKLEYFAFGGIVGCVDCLNAFLHCTGVCRVWRGGVTALVTGRVINYSSAEAVWNQSAKLNPASDYYIPQWLFININCPRPPYPRFHFSKTIIHRRKVRSSHLTITKLKYFIKFCNNKFWKQSAVNVIFWNTV